MAAELLPASHETESVWQALSASGCRCVAVTSAEPGEGVTTVAEALARRAAMAGSALLVEGNMARPGLAGRFPSGAEPGGIADAGGGLAVLARPGPEASAEWRETSRFAEKAREWQAAYDFVVIDASPVLASDGPVPGISAAGAAGSALLVVLSGVTPANRIADARQALDRAGAKLEGIVLNDWRSPSLLWEMERASHRLDRLLPGLADRIRGRLRRSALVNVSV